MVDRIYKLKNKFIERVEHDLSDRGIDRININEMGELIDIVKDLAEAEEKCMKARYYKTVVEAMGKHADAESPYGDHSEVIDKLAKEYRAMNADDRVAMKGRIYSILESE